MKARRRLLLPLIALAAPALAQSEMPPELIEAAKRPGGDALLRAAREEDHRQVVALNTAQAQRTAARDKAAVARRDAANDSARRQYSADMAAWRRRVAECRNGNWSQCDR